MNTRKDILILFNRLYKCLQQDEARLREELREKREQEKLQKLFIKLNKRH
jgi:hypothetical protein